MHAFRKAIIEMVTFLILENVPPSKKAALDALAIKFHQSHMQRHRKMFPMTNCSNGITNLTKISAAERLGLVFLFVILAQYDEGWTILNETLIKRTETNLQNVLHVFEALLCFDAWLNQETYWSYTNNESACDAAKQSIRVLLQLCRKNIPVQRLKPDCWKFPMFHELLHIVDDITRFGAPFNYCAQRPESLLIQAAKQPGSRSRKVHEGAIYELNAAQSLTNSLLIEIAYNRMFLSEAILSSPDVNDTTIKQSTGQATRGRILRQETLGRETSFTVTWTTVTDVSRMHLPISLLTFVSNAFGNSINVCTEYQ
jgi:hypothetical protein